MKKLALVLGLLGLISCGGSDGGSGSVADLIGTWLWSSTACDGEALVMTGFVGTMVVTSSTETAIATAPGCVATASYAYVADGNNLTLALTGVSCDPVGCSQVWQVNGTPTTVNCPADFGGNGGVRPFTVDGSTATTSNVVGSKTCTAHYVRQ